MQKQQYAGRKRKTGYRDGSDIRPFLLRKKAARESRRQLKDAEKTWDITVCG
ncbi:TPA: hypothetical protein JS291_000768 [Escherichia coli]|nr:hypothetical protein [Escherichia coli]MED9699766.1 hypothetical protein [Escherichia coli]HAY0215100.1 hypothetical protein [Escherichia coli]HEL7984755.1 hypothetical protein [Escherichia coli]HEM0050307.1 hypothetical protein [Escherichia coli]